MADTNYDLSQPTPPTTASYWPGMNPSPSEAAWKRSGKSKRDLLACYRTRTRMSKKWRYENYDKTWRRLVDLYKGKHFELDAMTGDRIAINICFSTVNTILPSVAVNEPDVRVTPRQSEQADAAEKIEAAINYWWRRYKWKLDVKRAVKDSIVTGNGWVKLGWKYAEKKRPTTNDEQQQQYAQAKDQVVQAAMNDPSIAADLPTDNDLYDAVDKDTWDVTHDAPFVERCSPMDIFIDPEATCEEDLKWIAQRIVAPIERVKGDTRYNAGARAKLTADMAQNPRWRDAENSSLSGISDAEKDDIQRVTLWEYWDIEHEYYCVFAENASDWLVDPTDFPYPFGHPFVHLGNYEVMDQFYSVGDLEMIEPIQHELNGVRSDMMNHRKRWQRAYMALRDKLDNEAMAVLASDEDGRVVYVDGDEDLTRIVVPIPQTSLDPQMYQYSQQVEDDLDLVSGITEYQRGSSPEIRRTATEANMIQSNTDARVADKLAQVEEFMSTIAERIVQLAQMYLTQEEVAAIVGQDGQQQWVTFTRDEIQGQYDFVIEAGSTTPKDDTQLRNDAMQLVQTLQPFMGEVVDPKAVVTYMLQNAFNIKDVGQFLVQQAPAPQTPVKLLENISYKDAPPDIQRQMEQQAGFTPSQVGGSSPAEGQAAAAQAQGSDQAHEQDMQAQGAANDQASGNIDSAEQQLAQQQAQIQQQTSAAADEQQAQAQPQMSAQDQEAQQQAQQYMQALREQELNRRLQRAKP